MVYAVAVFQITDRVAYGEKLRTSLEAEYVVLGGGNIKKLKKLPPGTRLGNNQNAFLGGFRMWADSQTASNLKNA